MDLNLSLYETRVIGVLIEKEITTPDQYPLSLNALTNACNQKSNRDPVLNLDEVTVQQTVDELVKKRLISEKTGFGSRVPKFQHRFCNSQFGSLNLSPQELGILCELFLRGPQTPGELRTHTNRLCAFSEVSQVETTLKRLMEREDGPFVVQLSREAGRRDSRFAHRLSGEVSNVSITEDINRVSNLPDSVQARIERLEQAVSELQQHVVELKQKIERLSS